MRHVSRVRRSVLNWVTVPRSKVGKVVARAFWRRMSEGTPGGDPPGSRFTVPTVTVSDLPVPGPGMPAADPSSFIDSLTSQDRAVPSGSSSEALHRTVPGQDQGAESPLQNSSDGPGSNPGHVLNHPSHRARAISSA